MIIDFYGRNSGGGGGGGVTPAQVRTIVNAELDKYTDNIENGDPVVGMAAQLQSTDGFKAQDSFFFRTTGGDASLSNGDAKLLKISAIGPLFYNDPIDASATAVTTSGPRLSVTYNGDLETLYTELDGAFGTDEITFVYDYAADEFVTDLTDMGYVISDFTINGTPIDEDSFTFKITELEGPTFTANTTYSYADREISATVDANAFDEYTYVEGTTAYTYTYTNGSWGNKPNSVTFVGRPIEGDTITVNFTPHSYCESDDLYGDWIPSELVSTSMNQFNGEATKSGNVYTITFGPFEIIPQLEDGYVVYSKTNSLISVEYNGHVQAPIIDNKLAYVYSNSIYNSVVIKTTDKDSICVHPRWSGIKDEVYGEYWTSTVDIPQVWNFHSLGSLHNEIDFENGLYIERVSAVTATRSEILALRADTNKTYGVDYVCNNAMNMVLLPLDSAVTTDISSAITSNVYKADDFGTEKITTLNKTLASCGRYTAEIEYKTNLVDKLRVDVLTRSNIVRLTQSQYDSLATKDPNTQYIITDANAVDMDSYKDIVDCTEDGLPTEGVEGKMYKWNGLYFEYVEQGNVKWGNWSVTRSNGFTTNEILYYDFLPSTLEGQKLLKMGTDSAVKYAAYFINGSVVVYGEDSKTGTPITTIALGEEKTFSVNGDSNLKITFTSSYISFYNQYARYHFDLCSTDNSYYGVVLNNYYAKKQNVVAGQAIPIWNSEGVITGKRMDVENKSFKINNTVYYVFGSNSDALPTIFAPTAGGDGSGYILQSVGSTSTPTWVSLASMMGGLTIWCGTEDEYDAITTKDSNTLYIIREE